MASIPNLPANVLANNEQKHEPEIVTTTNTLQRTDSSAMNPPGAWVSGDDDYKNDGESPVTAIGDAVVGALGAAGNTAAKYLPTSFMNTYNAYAPTGMTTSNPNVNNASAPTGTTTTSHPVNTATVTAPKEPLLNDAEDTSTAAKYLPASVVNTYNAYAPTGMTTTSNPNVNNATTTSKEHSMNDGESTAAKYLPASVVNTFNAYAPTGMTTTGSNPNVSATAQKEEPLTTGPAQPATVPSHMLTHHAMPAPESVPSHMLSENEEPDFSINKDSGSEVPSRRSTQDNWDISKPVSERTGLATAAQFVSPSVMTPPTPASGNRDIAKPVSERTGLAQFAPPSVMTPPTPASGKPSTISTTAVTGHESARSGFEPPPPSAATSPLSSTARAMEGLYIKDPTPEKNVASSVVSVKSGHVGSGPTGAQAPMDKSLPSTPAPAFQSGVTPRESALEKDDLSYLAPHIREQNSTQAVPTLDKPAHHENDYDHDHASSRFTEGSSAHPTPASDLSSSTGTSHSRESSASMGGTHKVSLVKRIRGEAKIIAGKIKKDDAKVLEGRAMMRDE